jgi:hypothetical protein
MTRAPRPPEPRPSPPPPKRALELPPSKGAPPRIPGVPINGGVTHLGRSDKSDHTLCGVPIIPTTRWLPHDLATTAESRLCAMCVGRFHRLQAIDRQGVRFGGA